MCPKVTGSSPPFVRPLNLLLMILNQEGKGEGGKKSTEITRNQKCNKYTLHGE